MHAKHNDAFRNTFQTANYFCKKLEQGSEYVSASILSKKVLKI